MSKPPILRRTYLVNRKLQLTLILTFFLMMSFGLSMAWVLSYFLGAMVQKSWALYMGFALVWCLSISISGLYMVFITNRIAGPLHRLRRVMLEVAQGGDPIPQGMREDDLTNDLILAYNELIKRIPHEESKDIAS